MNPSTPDKSARDESLALSADETSSENLNLKESEASVEDAFSKMQEELGLVHDRYLRLGAEFENFKKRSERERLTSIRFANENLLTELLPVLDHLEHAIAAATSHAASGEIRVAPK